MSEEHGFTLSRDAGTWHCRKHEYGCMSEQRYRGCPWCLIEAQARVPDPRLAVAEEMAEALRGWILGAEEHDIPPFARAALAKWEGVEKP